MRAGTVYASGPTAICGSVPPVGFLPGALVGTASVLWAYPGTCVVTAVDLVHAQLSSAIEAYCLVTANIGIRFDAPGSVVVGDSSLTKIAPTTSLLTSVEIGDSVVTSVSTSASQLTVVTITDELAAEGLLYAGRA